MLRKLIEVKIGPISDVDFKATLAIATMDIKFNRIEFLQRTSLQEAIKIAAISATTLRKCG